MAGSVEEALALIRQRCAGDPRLELAVISLESALVGGGEEDSANKRRVGGWSYQLESLLQTLLCARLLRNSATCFSGSAFVSSEHLTSSGPEFRMMYFDA